MWPPGAEKGPRAVEDEDLEVESGKLGGQVPSPTVYSLSFTLLLAFQSIGIIYGDLATSPLYVLSSTFDDGLPIASGPAAVEEQLVGAVSLVIWTLTLIALLKYVIIVLAADDNGEGGTFALYSLLCRHARVGVMRSEQTSDLDISTYSRQHDGSALKGFHARLKKLLESSPVFQKALLGVVILATSMVIGDGVLTPAISVLASVSGLRVRTSVSQGWLVTIACLILVGLFLLQSRGTAYVGYLFAPIVSLWLLCIAVIGVYNIVTHNPKIFRAASPHYAFTYLLDNGRPAWISLGGIILAITGCEGMFADLGHFNKRAIQLSFSLLVYPSLILQYLGQAAYLTAYPHHVPFVFYQSIPSPVFWPMFVVASLAAIVASQAMISGTFSIVRQAMAMGCFPRLRVVHTSSRVQGQVYIPFVNWALMLLTLAVTVGFQETATIGHAYGVAVMSVLLLTTLLVTLVMLIVWQTPLFLALLFLACFGAVECVYLSAALFKVPQGGWLPLALSLLLGSLMAVWHYGASRQMDYDRRHRLSLSWLLSLGTSLGMTRVPGLGLFYTDLTAGVPPIFSHFLANLPALHQVLLFVCVRYIPVPYVLEKDRFLIRHVGPRDFRLYRCIVRLGYKQPSVSWGGDSGFEEQLMSALKAYARACAAEPGSESAENSLSLSYSNKEAALRPRLSTSGGGGILEGHTLPLPQLAGIREEAVMKNGEGEGEVGGMQVGGGQCCEEGGERNGGRGREVGGGGMLHLRQHRMEAGLGIDMHRYPMTRADLEDGESLVTEDSAELEEELEALEKAKECGVVYIVGNSHIKAVKGSWWGRRWVLNGVYAFLTRNFRGSFSALGIPHACLVEIGMVSEV